jgi:hypothetical protein
MDILLMLLLKNGGYVKLMVLARVGVGFYLRVLVWSHDRCMPSIVPHSCAIGIAFSEKALCAFVGFGFFDLGVVLLKCLMGQGYMVCVASVDRLNSVTEGCR